MIRPVNVGLIGCGAISGAYFEMAKSFSVARIVACADIDTSRAEWAARSHGITAMSVDALLADPSIEIILNLTVPLAHAEVSRRALAAGKHVYVEKPLAVSREEGAQLVALAESKSLRIGTAPDTFLGAGFQTARHALDDGLIGKPVAFTAFMMGGGHEHWHPNPEFYYASGGGPMLDMGPYYITALMNLLGPVKRVMGMTSISRSQRTITHRDHDGKPMHKFGNTIDVQTADHICGTLEFQNGCIGSIITSFATPFAEYNCAQPITIFGTHGTMRVPDPNQFNGPVHVRKPDDADWIEVQSAFTKGYGRFIGVADLAHAIRTSRAHRTNAGFAVLDVMLGFYDSATDNRAYHPRSSFTRAASMPIGLPFGTLDD